MHKLTKGTILLSVLYLSIEILNIYLNQPGHPRDIFIDVVVSFVLWGLIILNLATLVYAIYNSSKKDSLYSVLSIIILASGILVVRLF